MSAPRAITARKLWQNDAFRDGLALVVSGDTIEQVLPTDQLGPISAEDWGDVALIPGTVNAHGHAFQNLFKGIADDLSFESWRDDVLYPRSAELDTDAIYVGALFAFSEALLAGITTTVDFFYLHDAGHENARAVIRAAEDAGIRLVLARTFYDPDAPTAAPQRYREPAADAAVRLRELADLYRDNPLVSIQPAPHSLHACEPATLAMARDVARDLGVPWHLHLAEARYEIDLVAERYGTTPVRLLQREGLLDDGLVAIHAVWVDDEELDLLAEHGSGIVHCPGANAFLGDGVARLDEMLARGIRVALGPDGGCANNRQSVFEEMRLASLFVKARRNDGAAVAAPDVFRLGTSGGADLLGLPVGELATGRKADVVAIDLADLSLLPTGNLERHIVNSMQSTAIAKVMVGGQVVVDERSTTTVDRADLRMRLDEVTKEWKRPGEKLD
ncbi:MAG: amidohydrolase family protein [Actinomycetota bacterium]|nr:amidohydrolase family protein [Actinomycetota bacterium]